MGEPMGREEADLVIERRCVDLLALVRGASVARRLAVRRRVVSIEGDVTLVDELLYPRARRYARITLSCGHTQTLARWPRHGRRNARRCMRCALERAQEKSRIVPVDVVSRVYHASRE